MLAFVHTVLMMLRERKGVFNNPMDIPSLDSLGFGSSAGSAPWTACSISLT